MVMFEYIPYGDLLGFLKRSRGLDDQYFNDPDIKPNSSLTSEQLLKFAGEIADGMAYLEARKVSRNSVEYSVSKRGIAHYNGIIRVVVLNW